MFQQSKVTVVADDLGNVISMSQNPEFGYIKLAQNVSTMVNGWLKVQKRTVLIAGKINELQSLNLKANQEFPGKIVVKEQLVPFDTKNAERELKKAGNTEVVCRIDDQPIYRKTFYVENENEHDVLLQHTNTDEIREALAAQKELAGISLDN